MKKQYEKGGKPDRRPDRKNGGRSALWPGVLLLGSLLPAPLLAAPQPLNAGTLGNQLRQTQPQVTPAPALPDLHLPADAGGRSKAPADDGARVVLERVVFSGPVPFPDELALTSPRLQAVVAPWLHRKVSFADLQALTDAVTREYRERGLLLARAVLPPQTIKGGVLTVQIIPGQYDAARLHNTSTLNDAALQRVLSATLPAGEVVRKEALERAALLLSEIPGGHSQVSLTAGGKAGTTSPDVTVTPGKRVAGYLGLDNQGDPTTGRSRVLGGIVVNNLSGWGDQLRIDALDAYENSDLFNGMLDYSLPVGGWGTRVGASYSHLNYRYDFMQLGYRGYSDNWQLYVTHPWVRTAQARVDVRLDGGQQYLTDKYPSALLGDAGATGRKRVTLGSLGVNGSVAALPGGVSGFALQGTLGQTEYRNDVAQEIAFSREVGSGGAFSRLNWQLSHDQQVWGPLSAYGRLSGQQASHNLDSSQKFLLGGPAGVRAYDIGAGAVDNGTLGTVELRSTWPVPAAWGWLGSQPGLTVAAFYDQGWGEQFKSNDNRGGEGNLTAQNRQSLSGAGLYATLADRDNYALTLTWAQRTGQKDPVSGRSDNDQFWVSAVKMF
ncbi:TPA: ShlB/FhaC/HecB family hemolysin secretion/activation protein [Salmonella enterica]|nr:ShlB/FhaC/HecB family hemolysin secretion/activation protein [Salmonella enterica]